MKKGGKWNEKDAALRHVEVMLEERKQEELQKKAEKMAAIEEREAPTKKPEKAILVIALIMIVSMIAVSGIYLLLSRKK
mgnify:CR=1 FL=1